MSAIDSLGTVCSLYSWFGTASPFLRLKTFSILLLMPLTLRLSAFSTEVPSTFEMWLRPCRYDTIRLRANDSDQLSLIFSGMQIECWQLETALLVVDVVCD